MMSRRKSLFALLLLIFLMNVLKSHAIICLPSHYPIGYICCPKCPPGTQISQHCTESEGGTHCKACTEGTFTDQQTGYERCCKKCDAGSGLRIKTSCTQSSDSVCEPLEGFFCTDPTVGNCLSAQRHKSCGPGHYVSQNGTSLTDAVCSPCSDGTFSDGMFRSCKKHTECDPSNQQLLRPGNKSQDAECRERDSNWIGGIVCGLVFCVFYLVMPSLVFLGMGGIRLGRIRVRSSRRRLEPIPAVTG